MHKSFNFPPLTKNQIDIITGSLLGEDKFAIYVGRKSYFDFIDMILPYVQWKCFKTTL